tara:strand:+ start:1614 stop:2609 length:996 start_codon:yes stop_codon:yes gene_type:complete
MTDISNIITDSVNLLPEDEAQPIVRSESPVYGDWPEYREHVGHIRCVICQHTGGQDSAGDPIEEMSLQPQLIRVSDAHHLTTKGAGGPDAENLVPLCRVHHNEFHSMGVDSFQLHYNYDLRRAAQVVFDSYMQTFDHQEHAQLCKAKHQRLLSRVFHFKRDAREIGEMILEFRETRIGNRRPYEWIGFDRFESWVSAPVNAGGLGISTRSSWRYQNQAKLYRMFPGREEEVDEINSSKCQAIIQMLEKTSSDEEKENILHQAKSQTTEDLISWRNQQEGRPDPKIQTRKNTESLLFDMLNEHGIYEVDETVLQTWAQKILTEIDARRYANN